MYWYISINSSSGLSFIHSSLRIVLPYNSSKGENLLNFNESWNIYWLFKLDRAITIKQIAIQGNMHICQVDKEAIGSSRVQQIVIYVYPSEVFPSLVFKHIHAAYICSTTR